jgi:excisionase family DNA binding protein
MEQFLTIQEAATVLRVSPSTVRRLCATGSIKCINVGTQRQRLYRIFKDTINEINVPEKPSIQSTPSFGRLDKMLARVSGGNK